MSQPDAPEWAAVVRPGDTLVVGFDHVLSNAEVEMLQQNWSRRIPDVTLAVLGQVVSMSVKPGEGES